MTQLMHMPEEQRLHYNMIHWQLNKLHTYLFVTSKTQKARLHT